MKAFVSVGYALLITLMLAAILALAVVAWINTGKRGKRGKHHSTPGWDDEVGVANVGVTPAGLALVQRGKTLYVANNNNYGLTGADSVSVVDVDKQLLKTTIFDSSFNEPYTVSTYLNFAYVTNSGGTTVTVIDTRTNQVVQVITGFDGPSGFAVVRQLARAYVNNYGSSFGVGSGNGTTVSVVDLTTNAIVGPPIVVGLAPAALAASPDGTRIYVINYVDGNPGTGTMSIIDTATNSLLAQVPGFSGPFGIAITPDGRYALVTNFGSNNFFPIGTTVSVVDLRALSIIKTIDVGIQPAGVAIDSEGKFAYVTNYNTLYASPGFMDLTAGQGTVNVIDLQNGFKLLGPTIAVGQSPPNIVVDSRGKQLLVTNYTSNTVSFVQL